MVLWVGTWNPGYSGTRSVTIIHTLIELFVDTECDVDADDSELETDSGDPGRLIFLRFRGRPFNLGAVGKF